MNSKIEFLHFQDIAVLPADAPLHVVLRFSACGHAEMLFSPGSGKRRSLHFSADRTMPESVISILGRHHGFSYSCTVSVPAFQDGVSWFIRGELPVSPVVTVYGLTRKAAGTRKAVLPGSFTRSVCRLKPSRFRKYAFGGLRL